MIEIFFVHEAPTPHNSYLLSELRKELNVTLTENYFFPPHKVPGRPWEGQDSAIDSHISFDKSKWFSVSILWKAVRDKSSVFFVIGWNWPTLVFLLFILGVRRRPLLIWDDGPDPSSLASFKKWWLPKTILKRVLIYLINRTPGTYFHTGDVTRNAIVSLGISEEKLKNLPFFVKPGAIDNNFRRDFGFCDSDFVVLAGGRLIESKGFDLLLEAISKVHDQERSRLKLVLVGSGPEESLLKEMSLREDLQNVVTFLPWADPDRFAALVHSCDCFVAPARFDHFPTTVILAMHAGIPVIASDGVGSAVEFIKTGVNGIITESGSINELTIALEELMVNESFRLSIGRLAAKSLDEWKVRRGVEEIYSAAKESL